MPQLLDGEIGGQSHALSSVQSLFWPTSPRWKHKKQIRKMTHWGKKWHFNYLSLPLKHHKEEHWCSLQSCSVYGRSVRPSVPSQLNAFLVEVLMARRSNWTTNWAWCQTCVVLAIQRLELYRRWTNYLNFKPRGKGWHDTAVSKCQC